MSDRKPSPFPILLNNDVCSLIQAAEDGYAVTSWLLQTRATFFL